MKANYLNREGWLKFRVGKKNDKRIKLSPEQKEQIYQEYQQGKKSQRYLAKEYGVSRRTITFIVDPQKLKNNIQRRLEKGGSKQYYDKDKHREYMRDHRKHIKELLKKNQIGNNI